MTDTARTLTAIKTLLADNANGAISPQDVRDGIESIVNPVVGGGFPGSQAGEVSLFRIDASMTPVTSNAFPPYVVYTPADPAETHRWDPLGIRQTGSNYVSTSQGDTWPDGSWFLIDQGLYVSKMLITWAASAVGDRYAGLLPIDNRVYEATPPVYDHVFWGPGQWDTFQLTGGGTPAVAIPGGGMFHTTSTLFRVTEAMGPSAYGAMINQDTGSPLALTSGVLMIMRIGDCNAPL
jgi:hypothetical protein